MSQISLTETILGLRSELEEARRQAADQGLRFKVEDIELEVEVLASKQGKAGGKVSFWVYNAELGGEMREATRQKLKLRLSPVGGDLEVGRTGKK